MTSSNLAELAATVGKGIGQSPKVSANGYRFQLSGRSARQLEEPLYFAFPGEPACNLSVRFESPDIVVAPGSGDLRDTVIGSTQAFQRFFENEVSAQALFLEVEWKLGDGRGRAEGDLSELREALRALEDLLRAPYELTDIPQRVRANAARLGHDFQIVETSDGTSSVLLEQMVRAGQPCVLREATPVEWWSFENIAQTFQGMYTDLSRYPNCGYAVDKYLAKILSRSPDAFKAALPLTASLRANYFAGHLFPCDSIFAKAQTVLLAPADHYMPSSYRATSWHRDWADNLLAQMIGEKRVRVASPLEEEAFAAQRVPPCHYNVGVDYSAIDPKSKDACAGLNTREVVLQPGDVLFIPCGWFHTVENCSPSAAINCWKINPPEALAF